MSSLQAGKCIHTVITDRGIERAENIKGAGYYIAPLIDIGVSGHEWSRLKVQIRTRSETRVTLFAMALETLSTIEIATGTDYKSWFDDPVATVALLAKMKTLPHLQFDNPEEVLLYELSGQYLIFWLEIYSSYHSDSIEGFEITYEKESWMDYLPQVYSERGDFLEKFLAIFQTPFDHVEHFVDDIASLYAPERTPEPYLEILNDWLKIDGFRFWPPDKRRQVIKAFPVLNRLRGTREGLIKIIELYTDATPMIVESIDFKGRAKHEEMMALYDKLYDSDIYGVTVLIPARAMTGACSREGLEAIIKDYIPVQARLKLVLTEERMILGAHTYMGINTRLFDQQAIRLDDQSMIAMGIISDDSERMEGHAKS
jgi:phage tail-like protein